MHDLYAAQDIIEVAVKTAKSKKIKKISKLTISLGQIEDHGDVISESNLRFNIKMLAKNTLVEGATVVIEKSKGHQCVLTGIEGDQ